MSTTTARRAGTATSAPRDRARTTGRLSGSRASATRATATRTTPSRTATRGPGATTRVTGGSTVRAAGGSSAQPAAAAGPARVAQRYPVAHALVAAEQAVRRNSLRIHLPLVGELRLPATEELAFVGGVALLAAVGLLDWPVAVLLGVGHGLALNRRNKVVRAFGEALEAA